MLVVFLYHSSIHQIFFMKNGEIALTQSRFFAVQKEQVRKMVCREKYKGKTIVQGKENFLAIWCLGVFTLWGGKNRAGLSKGIFRRRPDSCHGEAEYVSWTVQCGF